MNINLELYKIFCVVANTGNITKASEELMISQPAISKSIKNLEEQLGGDLFIRTKRGVILTEEGKEFYQYIKKAMEYIDNAERKFNDLINLDTGCIKIGIGSTLTKEFLIPFLEIFHEKYPKIDIKIINNITSNLLEQLKNGFIDLVIMTLDNQDYSDFNIIKCKERNDCFVANPKYYDLTNKKLSLKDLNNYPLILQLSGSNTRNFLDDFAKENNVSLKPTIELANYSLVVEFAKLGLGIGYATKEFIKSDLDNRDLFMLNIKENIPTRYISIVTAKNHLPNFSANKLIEIITK